MSFFQSVWEPVSPGFLKTKGCTLEKGSVCTQAEPCAADRLVSGLDGCWVWPIRCPCAVSHRQSNPITAHVPPGRGKCRKTSSFCGTSLFQWLHSLQCTLCVVLYYLLNSSTTLAWSPRNLEAGHFWWSSALLVATCTLCSSGQITIHCGFAYWKMEDEFFLIQFNVIFSKLLSPRDCTMMEPEPAVPRLKVILSPVSG